MRSILFLLLIIISTNVHSQSSVEKFLDSAVAEVKAQTKIDKNDLRILSLLEAFYAEALQSDQGELSQQTGQKANAYISDSTTSNVYILILFLMYQQYIGETTAQGKPTEPAYQLACVNLLEKELLAVYQKVPTIIYIYKAEALENAGRKDEARAVVEAGLKKDPVSIPLKVYRYLDTKDEAIRADLVKNHAGHWMVQQNKIK